jgi:hypothetical protein
LNAPGIQSPMIEREFNRDLRRELSSPVNRDVGVCLDAPTPGEDPAAERPPIRMENVMKGRLLMVLASALLAGSLVATGAQARGGGGGGGGHGGGFGGGHMGGFGGGHIGGFGGGHMGGFGGAPIGGIGGGHIAGIRGDHFGAGRRHFAGRGFYDYGLDCPYYLSYNPPYTCTY